MRRIEIIRPSSREPGDYLSNRIKELETLGFTCSHTDTEPDASFPYVAANAQERLRQLQSALDNEAIDIIWCARGGYGASDLLPLLDWEQLSEYKPKTLIGFSDVSALHAAFWTKLRWRGLHAPMLATSLWGQQGRKDLDILLSFLQGKSKLRWSESLDSYSGPIKSIAKSPLFGGCLSVLTNLIGTSYLPKSLSGHIVFFEDTGENPGRLMRMLNQWLQAGILEGCSAVVLGFFRDCTREPGSEAKLIYEQFGARLACPVFQTNCFGHTSPNMPLPVGGYAEIVDSNLNVSDSSEDHHGAST